jgi:hypothetical protein
MKTLAASLLLGAVLAEDILYHETRSAIDSDDQKVFTPPMNAVTGRRLEEDVLYEETRSAVDSDDQKTFTPPMDGVGRRL